MSDSSCPSSKLCNTVTRISRFKISILESLSSVLALGIRLFMAKIFWISGWHKFNDWETALLLFEDEHPVPFLPESLANTWDVSDRYLSPEIAAVMGTGGELVLSAMLVLGFGGRIAAAGLLVMTAVINFTYLHSIEHAYWALLLAVPLFYGPGKLSIDHLIRKKFL